ncbi:MinD/ParA family protein [Candidatus Gracilibacteria bacterium]|nr:MinD/ParA family protein [Candidatus Gracilibacteria bacterium]
MAQIISIHSFRGGTGKSNTTANLAGLFAAQGYRVGVIDTDIQSPGIHVLFGLAEEDTVRTLNDYLWGECTIEEAAYQVTGNLGREVSGEVFLIPSSSKAGEITRVLREGYDPGLLSDGVHRLIEELSLDLLLIDTHPGLNEETLLSIAISDTLLVIMRPDQQDYQGTSVTVDIAKKLDVPRLLLLVNKVPLNVDTADLRLRVQQIYQCPVAGVIPHSDELMILASSALFALRFPEHPLTELYHQLALLLASGSNATIRRTMASFGDLIAKRGYHRASIASAIIQHS